MASDVKFDVILSLATRSVRLNPPALPPPLWLDSCKISSWSLFPVVLVCIPKYRFWGQLSYLVVFLDGSVGKESTCNAEDAMTQFNPWVAELETVEAIKHALTQSAWCSLENRVLNLWFGVFLFWKILWYYYFNTFSCLVIFFLLLSSTCYSLETVPKFLHFLFIIIPYSYFLLHFNVESFCWHFFQVTYHFFGCGQSVDELIKSVLHVCYSVFDL